MMHSTPRRVSQQIDLLRRQFAQSDELPFGNVLSAELVQRVLAEACVKVVNTVYTPLTTLLLFLWQVLSQDQSCRAVVAKLKACRAALGLPPCSSKTGAYCLARQRIPERVYAGLVRGTAEQLEAQAPAAWLWQGRSVKVFDGSTVSMPDTPANQQAYPQHGRQAPGVGFPLARIAAVFSLATGAVLDLGICRHRGKGQSELGLLRLLWDLFAPGDVMLADRYLCSWNELAVLGQRGVDFVARLHPSRLVDFRRGQRLGKDDHLVTWRKSRRPDWMDPILYESLPEELTIREVRVRIDVPGFRTRQIVIATSLLDPGACSKDKLAELYRARWHAELDLRSLKETLQMDVLRCKSPELVRAEIWTHLLAYNLVRTVMAQAASRFAVQPRRLSFKGTVQALLAFQPRSETCALPLWSQLHAVLLKTVSEHPVGDRPNRCEPRQRKRRPKAYPLLHKPRPQARDDLRRYS